MCNKNNSIGSDPTCGHRLWANDDTTHHTMQTTNHTTSFTPNQSSINQAAGLLQIKLLVINQEAGYKLIKQLVIIKAACFKSRS